MQPLSTSVDNSITEGLRSAFILSNVELTDPEFSPQFLYNDSHSGIKVISTLEDELQGCQRFAISVAFITRSGVTPLLPTLKALNERGVPGRILTTDYLSFTEPVALQKLLEFKNLDIRLFQCATEKEGFHTKGYIFEQPDVLHLIIGSSNWTQSALACNREWNARLISTKSGEFATKLLSEFESLWERASKVDVQILQTYTSRREKIRRLTAEVQQLAVQNAPSKQFLPNPMQTTFVNRFLELRKNGAHRALLISATGTGKTYAAAFGARAMAPKSILFLVHREQIARQALKSFRAVLGGQYTYRLLSGTQHDTNATCLFATMQTMAKPKVHTKLIPSQFDLIIIDEAHRAGAESYQRIMAFFKPKFWLGMTASPERTDDFDVYKLFDHNIAYEIRLQDALSEDLLCPFHYFGIPDRVVNGESPQEARNLNDLTSDERVRYILEQLHFYGYSGDRVKGLIFCSSLDECNILSTKFNNLQLRTAVASGKSIPERENLVDRLKQAEDDKNALDYIFSVDVFNEGVDIPEVNQIVLLRPTESPIVFVQQLGRGLRKAPGKDFVVVLDFIGNYRTNFLIPVALSGDRSYDKDNMRRFLSVDHRRIPGASSIHFDEVTRERIFAAIDSANTQDLKLLKDSYRQLKSKLGRVPSLTDFEQYGSIDPVKFFDKTGSYYTFLCQYDNDFKDRMSPAAEEVLNFCSRRLGRAQRLSEAFVIEAILSDKRLLKKELRQHLADSEIFEDDAHFENVFAVLTNGFNRNADETRKQSHCVLLASDGDGDWRPAAEFLQLLRNNPLLKNCLSELIGFMKTRWSKRYRQRYQSTDFTLCEKYTYDDVCRLLNWRRNVPPQNIGGYFYDKETQTLPVFINYEKATGAIAYEDRFTSPSDLIAISKTKRQETSPDADHIYKRTPSDKNNKIYLFVRRNKDDHTAKSFYFLGEINAVDEPIPKTLPSKEAVFEIHYRLTTPVQHDIYRYLTRT